MDIKVELKNSFGRLAVREPFLIGADTVPRLIFVTDYALNDAIVTFKTDERTHSFRVQDLRRDGITVPQDMVKAGTLHVTLALLVGERVVKRYTVEPVVFAEEDTGFAGHPEFEAILTQLAAAKDALAWHGEKLTELAEKSGKAEADIVALWNAVEQ